MTIEIKKWEGGGVDQSFFFLQSFEIYFSTFYYPSSSSSNDTTRMKHFVVEWMEGERGKGFWVGHSGIIRQHTGLYTHLPPLVAIHSYSALCVRPFHTHHMQRFRVCVCRFSSWCKMGGNKKIQILEKKQQQNQTAATLPTPGSRSGFFFPFSPPCPTAIKC